MEGGRRIGDGAQDSGEQEDDADGPQSAAGKKDRSQCGADGQAHNAQVERPLKPDAGGTIPRFHSLSVVWAQASPPFGEEGGQAGGSHHDRQHERLTGKVQSGREALAQVAPDSGPKPKKQAGFRHHERAEQAV